jgi:O-antigen/teichoic acid export membrane protein
MRVAQQASRDEPTSPFGAGFLGKVAVLAGSSAAGPLLLLLFYPLITRLYTPAQYGAFGLFEATLAIGIAVITLSYNQPIPLANDDAEASRLLALAFMAVACLSGVLALLIAWAGPRLLAPSCPSPCSAPVATSAFTPGRYARNVLARLPAPRSPRGSAR